MGEAPVPEFSFSHGSISGFCSFSQINSFNCFRVPQVEWKMNYIKYTKLNEYTKLLTNLICCFFTTSSVLTMRNSAKKRSQVQTIQRTVSSRNVTQDNNIMKKFWKGSRWFRRQSLRTFCYFLRTESRKRLFGKLHFYPSI